MSRRSTDPWWWREQRRWRERIGDLCWRLFWSDYTSWRRDRAYRRYVRKREGRP